MSERCPRCGSDNPEVRQCGSGLSYECKEGHADCPDPWHSGEASVSAPTKMMVPYQDPSSTPHPISPDCRGAGCIEVSAPAPTPTQRPRIYAASRASLPQRPAMWKVLRASGANIISSWIDEAEPGATADLGELWERIYFEIKSADQLVLYVERDDFPLKGALIEVGIALGLGKPVAVVAPGLEFDPPSYRPIGSWIKHPAVRIVKDVRQACLVRAAASEVQTAPTCPDCESDDPKKHYLVSQGEGAIACRHKFHGGVQTADERAPKDYAIEFGGYLADAAEAYLAERNRFDEKQDTDGTEVSDQDSLNDHIRALTSAVYEFRKRAARALSGTKEKSSS